MFGIDIWYIPVFFSILILFQKSKGGGQMVWLPLAGFHVYTSEIYAS
jgi:hypothetical protein